jgi:hypothetical protein
VPNFLCLDGPLNGLYATLAEAYEAGYEAPEKATGLAWNEPVVVWSST